MKTIKEQALEADQLRELVAELMEQAQKVNQIAAEEFRGRVWDHYWLPYQVGQVVGLSKGGMTFCYNEAERAFGDQDDYEIFYEWITMPEPELRKMFRVIIAEHDNEQAMTDQARQEEEPRRFAALSPKEQQEILDSPEYAHLRDALQRQNWLFVKVRKGTYVGRWACSSARED